MKQYSFYLGNSQQFKYTVSARDRQDLLTIIKARINKTESRARVVRGVKGLPHWMKSLKVDGYPSIILFYEGD